MRIWTTQTVSFWNKLQEQGVIHCDTSKSWGSNDYKEAYDWMVGQMINRIGPAPEGVDYPIWGWQQVGCSKKEYHGSVADCSGDDDEFVFITADIPDELVLLSDFCDWHCVLNHCHTDFQCSEKEANDEAGIIKSWDTIFDLNRRGRYIKHRRNRTIQATFWELRLEWVTATSRIKGFQRWQQQRFEKYNQDTTENRSPQE